MFYDLEMVDRLLADDFYCRDHLDQCGIYATISNNQFIIDTVNFGGKYAGNGKFWDDSIEINSFYNRRGTTVFYKLKGKKQ